MGARGVRVSCLARAFGPHAWGFGGFVVRLSELHGASGGSVRPAERRLCKVGAFIRSLDSEDAEWLSGALDDPSESSAGLRRTLRAAGFDVARSSLSTHRRGECCCYGVA